MSVEKIGTLVIGGGQAGLATSEHLSNNGVSHLVFERSRIAERWRSERWDSLVANGPAWHDRFPTAKFSDVDPEGFASKEQVAQYFEDFAKQINAPIRLGVEVKTLQKLPDGSGFRAETSDGRVTEAQNVVVATGPFQKPIIPDMVPQDANIYQIHSAHYRNPAQLPEGAVLVVGAGSSGAQIAEELMSQGRKVYLCVGPHDRPPRRYRGQDFVWWLGKLGKWDAKAITPGMEHVTIAVSGANGGKTVDFRNFAARGMTLLGRAQSFENGVMQFAPDLKKNIEMGDANYLSMLDEADAYVAREGLDLPEEPEARAMLPEPDCTTSPLLHLDLAEAGISTIVWATGYALDYDWLDVDVLDDKGRPIHNKGVSDVPGLYFVGLSWLSRRASAFIWGAWHDAKYIADHIAEREKPISDAALTMTGS